MYKVLIVDDLDIVRRELKRMPIWGERSGFELSAAAKNGHEALELLKTEEFDLIITDIRMPKVDGLELLRKINAKNQNQCVVLLSDYSEFHYARQGIVLGAFDYLTKPADPQELQNLLARVAEHLENRNRELDRWKQMEEKLEEKVSDFYPSVDVDRLTGLILAGSEASAETAGVIFRQAAANLDGEPIKMEFLLKRILNRITCVILEKKPWFRSFSGESAVAGGDLFRSDTVGERKESFTQRVEALRKLIYKLECGMTDNEVVKRMCGFVLDNIDGELSLKSVAEKLYMNRTYLSEVFRQKTGMQFVEYLTMVKMERARILLREGSQKTYEIAETLGFKDIEYFSRLFKKHTGVPPAEYRQMHTKA